MSKRNFILLIILLVIAVAVLFAYLFGSRRTTTSTDTGGGTNFISQFNPFGTGTTTPPKTTPTPVDVSGNQPSNTLVVKPKLIKVSSVPVAGFIVYQKERLKDVPISPTPAPTKKPTPPPTEFAPALRYIDRATGNIFQTFADKIAERKFSTTIIPKIYEAFFGKNADSVVMRYLKGNGKTIQTFVGNLPKEILDGDTTSDNQIKGSFLPEDIKDISISPDAGSIFYLFNSGDNILGTTMNLSTNKKAQVFDSPFTEWLSQWPSNKMITLTTKAAAGVSGYMYAMDPTSSGKGISHVLGNINGLTTLTSPSGKLILYGNDSVSLSIYHTDTKTSDAVGVRTLPEKCVWGKGGDVLYCAVPKTLPGGAYPDSWYQGEVSFSDQIWKLDMASGNTTILADPLAIGGGQELDGAKLALDLGENYLFFVNKKDSFLWELSIK